MSAPEILTIEEVAKFLRVSERTAYEWAHKGIIPGGKLGTSWRFKRSEIQKWVDDKLSTVKKQTVHHDIAIADVLAPDRVIIADCTLKKDALNAVIDCLVKAPEITNRDELAREIFHREELMSTGIGCGIGVPHVRLESVSNIVMAMGVSRADITDYVSLDGKPVRIVCMIAAGRYQHAKYIKTLAEISSILKEHSVREALIEAPDTESIYKLIVNKGN